MIILYGFALVVIAAVLDALFDEPHTGPNAIDLIINGRGQDEAPLTGAGVFSGQWLGQPHDEFVIDAMRGANIRGKNEREKNET